MTLIGVILNVITYTTTISNINNGLDTIVETIQNGESDRQIKYIPRYYYYLVDENGDIIHENPKSSDTSSSDETTDDTTNDTTDETTDGSDQSNDSNESTTGSEVNSASEIGNGEGNPGSNNNPPDSGIGQGEARQDIKVVQEIIALNQTEGRYQNFFFRVLENVSTTYPDAVGYVIIDANAEISSFNDTLTISSIICAVSFVSISIFSYFVSKILVKPYEQSYANEKRFLTNASHELKTPLTIISSNNELAIKDFGNQEEFKSTANQVKRMTVLVNEMVTLTKLDEESLSKVEYKEFNLTDLLYEAVSPYVPGLKARGVNVNLDIDEDVTLNRNETQCFKMFSIFLDNMNKYTNDNGEVLISLKKTNKGVNLVFKNTSIGLDPKKSEHLFERFYRMDESRDSSIRGYGIGLSIAKKLANLNKAKLTPKVTDSDFTMYIQFN